MLNITSVLYYVSVCTNLSYVFELFWNFLCYLLLSEVVNCVSVCEFFYGRFQLLNVGNLLAFKKFKITLGIMFHRFIIHGTCIFAIAQNHQRNTCPVNNKSMKHNIKRYIVFWNTKMFQQYQQFESLMY